MAKTAPRADTNKVASQMHVIDDPSAADVDLTAISKAPKWAAQRLELTNTHATDNADIVLRPEGRAADGSEDVTVTLVAGEVKQIRFPVKAIESTGSSANIQVVAYWWDPGGSPDWNK